MNNTTYFMKFRIKNFKIYILLSLGFISCEKTQFDKKELEHIFKISLDCCNENQYSYSLSDGIIDPVIKLKLTSKTSYLPLCLNIEKSKVYLKNDYTPDFDSELNDKWFDRKDFNNGTYYSSKSVPTNGEYIDRFYECFVFNDSIGYTTVYFVYFTI